jgi:dipeptidyl aminopeptidase/acylaminoacyl peptidase
MGVQSIAFDTKAHRLAYVSYTARANIWSLPIPDGATVDASAAKPLTTGSQIVESLRVSPDGKWLVFDSTLNVNAEAYRMPLEGGTATQLTRDPADDFAPDLSPDGLELAFHSWRAGNRDIYVQAVEGRSAHPITNTPNHEGYPIWSPDGTRLAFVDMTAMVGGKPGRLLVTRRASGSWSAPESVSDRVEAMQGSWLGNERLIYATDRGIEAFSLDGRATEVVCGRPSGLGDLWPMNITVAEDGRTLYFKSRDGDGRASIWAAALTGCKPRRLVFFADLDRPSTRGDFGAGAGRFFFTIEDRQADIWVAEVAKR